MSETEKSETENFWDWNIPLVAGETILIILTEVSQTEKFETEKF